MSEPIHKTLEQRGRRYGEFKRHAAISQALQGVVFGAIKQGESVLADDQHEAIQMICHKLARIANGDPHYDDSWRDIAGYAMLVADRLALAAPQPRKEP